MLVFKSHTIKALGLLAIGLLLLQSCRKETEVTQIVEYDNVIYEVDTVALYGSNLEKNKQKSASQYYSILFNDLFRRSIGSSQLNDLSTLSLSMGDKAMANQLVAGNYLNQSTVRIPTATEMRQDVDGFVEETYLRFYLRKPTELEKLFFIKLINDDPDITPELIYTAFIESNEYAFY